MSYSYNFSDQKIYSNAGGGWYLNIPNFEGSLERCYQTGGCPKLGYVTTPHNGLSGYKYLTMTVEVQTTGNPVFNNKLAANNTCDSPASARFLSSIPQRQPFKPPRV